MLHKMKKPSGAEVEVNESSLTQALLMGWKEVKETNQARSVTNGNGKKSNK